MEQFSATWQEQVVKRTCKESTQASYAFVVRQYVLPQIGTMRVDRLTMPRVQQLVNDLVDNGYSPDTVRNAYLRLRAMLNLAVRYRLVSHNVAEGVALPKLNTTGQQALTVHQVRLLLQAVEEHRLAALYHCLLTLGMRRGEVLGLAWRDLDWDAQTIKITQQVQPINGKTVINTPKTETSRRTLPLTDGLTQRLREHWRNQQEERRLRGTLWKEHGLIFASEAGTPISPQNLNHHFRVVRKQLDLPDIRLHDLRVTCATLLGELDVSDRVIGALLGHTPGNVTARYAKATLPAMREAVERLAKELLKKAA